MRFRSVFILLLFGFGIQSLQAEPGMWPNSVAIRQGLNIEWFRTATTGNDGSMILVWSDTKFGGRDLWAQKVDMNGNFPWNEQPLLIDDKFDRQEDPVIIPTSDNGYIIAWIDFFSDPDGNVYAQKVSESGQLIWQQGGVPLCTAIKGQISINGCPDNTGGAYINWIDSRNPSTDIYGVHLLADGSLPWPQNGIPIANSGGDESSNTMWEDGTGGFIIAYSNKIQQQTDLYMNRFLPGNSSAWGGPRVLSSGPLEQDMVKVAPDGTGSFIFTWKDTRNIDPQIYAQRVNLAGEFLWENPVDVYPEIDTIQSNQTNPRIIKASDTGVIITWEDNRNNYVYTDLYAQKLSISGAKLWGENSVPVAVVPFHQVDPRLVDDSNGGCLIVWDDGREETVLKTDIYAQHILADGSLGYEDNGIAICNTPGPQIGGLVKKSGDHYFICWGDYRNGSGGLYYQVINSSGTPLLEANGKQVIWGLSGDAVEDQTVMLKRNNDVIIIWTDSRFGNFGSRLFFQIIQPDSTQLMPINGKPVTGYTGADQEFCAAVVTPEGQVAITWSEQRGDYPKVYAQLLDINGDYLWGETGLEITQDTPIEQNSPAISFEDDAIYIAWSSLDSLSIGNLFRIWGQKFVNGQRMWGQDGKLISETPLSGVTTECLQPKVVGHYFTWLSQNELFVKLVDPITGDTAPGWNVDGNSASRYPGDDQIQLSVLAAKSGDDLVVLWEQARGSDFSKNLCAQKFNVNGTLAWDSLGVTVGDYGREQDMAELHVADDIYITWRENIDGFTQDIAIQKLSLNGEPLWGELGTFVIQRPSTQSLPSMAQIDPSNLLIAWEDTFGLESDILMRRMGTDGSGQDEALGYYVTNAPKSQYHPIITAMGEDKEFIVWEDLRSKGKTDIVGLYIQYVDYHNVVANSDFVTPVPIAKLYNNFPNPFNPETTIRFSLSKPGRTKLEIYNIKGQRVTTLVNETMAAGLHSFVWNGTNDDRKSVGSGIYFYKLSVGELSKTKKMILLK